MNSGVRHIGEIDRVVHEPGRLMIVALLSAVKQADFLFLQHETALKKGTQFALSAGGGVNEAAAEIRQYAAGRGLVIVAR